MHFIVIFEKYTAQRINSEKFCFFLHLGSLINKKIFEMTPNYLDYAILYIYNIDVKSFFFFMLKKSHNNILTMVLVSEFVILLPKNELWQIELLKLMTSARRASVILPQIGLALDFISSALKCAALAL